VGTHVGGVQEMDEWEKRNLAGGVCKDFEKGRGRQGMNEGGRGGEEESGGGKRFK